VEWDDEYDLDPYKEKNPLKHVEKPLATHTQMIDKVVIVLLCSQLMDGQLKTMPWMLWKEDIILHVISMEEQGHDK